MIFMIFMLLNVHDCEVFSLASLAANCFMCSVCKKLLASLSDSGILCLAEIDIEHVSQLTQSQTHNVGCF